MIRRTAIVIGLGVVFIAGFVVFGGTDPERLDLSRVARISVAVDTTADGKTVTGRWIVPAIRHWDFPEYWLQGGTRTFRTIRSPFDTVFLPLPTGQAMAVDLRNNDFDLTWYRQPLASPITRDRALYYLLDSLDRPKRLIDYSSAAQANANCPKANPVLDCKVSTIRTLLEAGPLDVPPHVGGSDLFAQRGGRQRWEDLRRFGIVPPKPLIFVGMQATIWQSSALRGNPDLQAGFRAFAGPTIVSMDRATMGRLLGPARVLSAHIDLDYDGASTWRLTNLDDSALSSDTLRDPPRMAHLTEILTADDIECCRWPNSNIKKQSTRSIVSAIEYRGETLAYEPTLPTDGKSQVLVDPDNGRVIWLAMPFAKVIWMLR